MSPRETGSVSKIEELSRGVLAPFSRLHSLNPAIKTKIISRSFDVSPNKEYLDTWAKFVGTFYTTQNTNVHRFTLSLHGLNVMMVESFPLKYCLLRHKLNNFPKTLACTLHVFYKGFTQFS